MPRLHGYTGMHAEAKKLRAAGWSIQRIAKHIGKPYTTTYQLVRDVKPAKKQPALAAISGDARAHAWDDAERWLASHDLRYRHTHRAWQSSAKDALARVYSASNEPHRTLANLRPLPITDHDTGQPSKSAASLACEFDSHGNYRRMPATGSDQEDGIRPTGPSSAKHERRVTTSEWKGAQDPVYTAAQTSKTMT